MQQEQFQQEEESLDIKALLIRYLRYWPWFALSIIIALTVSWLYLRYTQPVYEATAKIKILDDEKDANPIAEVTSLFRRSSVNLENETEILQSYQILGKVVDSLQLYKAVYGKGRVVNTLSENPPFNWKLRVPIDSIKTSWMFEINVTPEGYAITHETIEDSWSGSWTELSDTYPELPFMVRPKAGINYLDIQPQQFIIQIRPRQKAILSLRKSLSLEPVGEDSDILSITITGVNKQLNERTLNTLIEIFNQDGIEDRRLVSKRTVDFIDQRFLFLATELDSIEDTKQTFKQENTLGQIEADAGLALSRRATSEDQLFQLETQLELINIVTTGLSRQEQFAILPANLGLDNPAINSQISQFNELVLNYNKLKAAAGANNPGTILARDEIVVLRTNIERSLDNYRAQVQTQLKNIRQLNQRVAGVYGSIPEKEKVLRAIERQQSIKENLYLLLLGKREEAAISLAVTAPSLKVVDYAFSKSGAISPNRKQIYLIGFMLGLVVPIGILFLIVTFETRVQSVHDVEKVLKQIPNVGEVPKVEKGKSEIIQQNDRSQLAEAFRILRTNLQYLLVKKNGDKEGGNTLVVTSTIKGEGKTFVAFNLALTIAMGGKRVVLVGADIRNPKLTRYFSSAKAKSAKGLTEYIIDDSLDAMDVVNTSSFHQNLSVVQAGAIPPNPAELLMQSRTQTLFNDLKTKFDYVVADTAPCMLVTDTALLNTYADVMLYVIRAGYTDKKLLEFPVDAQREGRLSNIATVINNIDINRFGYGNKYGYYYAYSYTAEAKKSFWKRIFKR